MNVKLIHGLLFGLLLSLSAHVVHTSVMHETETCEVCIHVQSNDDWSDERTEHHLLFDVALHDRISTDSLSSSHSYIQNTGLIRGPPLFT